MISDDHNVAVHAIDGQNNTCSNGVLLPRVWWKVWLQKQFNIAYIEIYFKSEGKIKKKEKYMRQSKGKRESNDGIDLMIHFDSVILFIGHDVFSNNILIDRYSEIYRIFYLHL